MSKVAYALGAALLAPASLIAQVGHDPSHSPYRPIVTRTSLSAIGGYLGGSVGRIGIGPADGWLIGLRYEMRLTGPTDASLTISRGQFQRLIPNPNSPTDSAFTGPVKQSVIFVDAGLQVLLTGDKTWNRMAPYVGATLGMGFGSSVPADSSGYKYNAKFITGPLAGIRLHPGGGLTMRVEGRLVFWRLRYPSGFFNNPARAPTDPPLLDPNQVPDTDWTAHPTVLFGLGWAFRI
jgi:hypothetical protein